jgi:tetratricopeptide (TPR) repeat protein
MARSPESRRRSAAPPGPRAASLAAGRALALPLAFALLLAALGTVPAVRRDPHLLWSFLGASAALLAWTAAMLAAVRRRRRTLAVEIALRKQHYLQACAHISILLYWGWYWREVYDAAPLIAAQIAFAYAFDALLAWSRRDIYTLGFGPFPIVFSTNLFLWFKPEWFYLQFLMVGVGFAAKELIRWNKDGRRTHVFNPSSFTLMLFSVGLILTGSTGISWGPEIATTQLNPPHIYLLIFLVTLPAQFLFGTAPMTWAAVATTYLFGVAYVAATGTEFFPERPVPIAVFLGMHLLFTDPSTSPRSELGRLIFGVLYGLSVVGLLALLTFLNVPTFYDKLLPVPILNLLIQRIDRVAGSNALKRLDPAAIGKSLLPRWRNLAYMSMWAITFVTMQAVTGAEATLVRADSLLSQGRADEAMARYREFLRAEPADSDGHNNYGVALMQAGRLDDAIASFQRSIELGPDNANTLNNLGLALIRAGRPADAVAPLQRSVDLQPRNRAALDNLAQALMQSGRPAEGVASLQRAAAIAPDSPEAHDSLGVALMEAGRLEDAVAALERALAIRPDSAETLNNLGVALLRAGRSGAAVAPLQRAVDLQPGSGPYDNLGQALMQAGRLDEAVASFEHAVELEPDSPEALNHLGLALLQGERLADAVGPLRRAAALRPASVEAQLNLGAALIQAGHLDEGLAAFRRAIVLRPDSHEAHHALGRALNDAGRADAAMASFRRAVDLKPDYVEGRLTLARALADARQPRAAVVQLREALRLEPGNVPVLTFLAWLEAAAPDARDREEAVRLAARAADLTGRRDAQILDVLATAYAAAGRLEDAIGTAEAAEALASAGPDPELAKQISARLSAYRSRSGARGQVHRRER